MMYDRSPLRIKKDADTMVGLRASPTGLRVSDALSQILCEWEKRKGAWADGQTKGWRSERNEVKKAKDGGNNDVKEREGERRAGQREEEVVYFRLAGRDGTAAIRGCSFFSDQEERKGKGKEWGAAQAASGLFITDNTKTRARIYLTIGIIILMIIYYPNNYIFAFFFGL